MTHSIQLISKTSRLQKSTTCLYLDLCNACLLPANTAITGDTTEDKMHRECGKQVIEAGQNRPNNGIRIRDLIIWIFMLVLFLRFSPLALTSRGEIKGKWLWRRSRRVRAGRNRYNREETNQPVGRLLSHLVSSLAGWNIDPNNGCKTGCSVCLRDERCMRASALRRCHVEIA